MMQEREISPNTKIIDEKGTGVYSQLKTPHTHLVGAFGIENQDGNKKKA